MTRHWTTPGACAVLAYGQRFTAISEVITSSTQSGQRQNYPLAGNGLLANREKRCIGVLLERVGMVMNK